MDFTTQPMPAGGLGAVIADALLVVVVGTSVPPSLDKTLGALLGDAVAQGDFEFKPNRVLYIHRPAGCQVARLTLVCAPNPTPTAFKAAVACGLAAIKAFGVTALAVARVGGDAMTDAHAEALAAAVGDAVYLYRHTKPSAPAAPRLTRVVLVSGRRESASLARGLQRGAAIAAGVEVARECANRPGNHATPTFLASEARRIAKQYGMKVEVFDRRQIEKIGMGSFLAVAQGSDEPPRFIVVRYEGAAKSKAPIVLVGKGITFDSGGISIKPAAEMDEMKFDMGGAASVLGTLRAIGEIKPKVNVIGLIAACENLPSGRAIKPGDVVRSLSGQTIEILNTDAEGRLILCDALTYAERFKPAAVIDIATLTGACVVALGHHHSGLFAADEALAAELLAASRHAQDPAWRMPLDDEYGEVLKSHFA
ncbi:MAG: leucyl aminopeptidase, partial [Aquincola sp.]|nr:leucyl aminopeptidase [Aquincola sp.]